MTLCLIPKIRFNILRNFSIFFASRILISITFAYSMFIFTQLIFWDHSFIYNFLYKQAPRVFILWCNGIIFNCVILRLILIILSSPPLGFQFIVCLPISTDFAIKRCFSKLFDNEQFFNCVNCDLPQIDYFKNSPTMTRNYVSCG